MKDVSSNAVEGVDLTDEENEYLLPHFTMLLIGKPGSGKTTLLKQLVLNEQMYLRKFDYLILVSPSHSKMGIPIKKEFTKENFDLQWIFKKFEYINEKQREKIFGHSKGGRNVAKGQTDATGKVQMRNDFVIGDRNSRFFVSDFLKKYGLETKATTAHTPVITEAERMRMDMDRMYKEIQKMPKDEQARTRCNALLILDDVVGQIKKEEYNPLLAQLIMNRRHVLINGTVSIIIVSQKYTLIPARVRSNASWLVLFNLNPLDFENVYRDVITQPLAVWRDILRYIFGTKFDDKSSAGMAKKSNKDVALENQDDQQKETQEKGQEEVKGETIKDFIKKKKFENLGIWVEFGLFFKNFKRLNI